MTKIYIDENKLYLHEDNRTFLETCNICLDEKRGSSCFGNLLVREFDSIKLSLHLSEDKNSIVNDYK